MKEAIANFLGPRAEDILNAIERTSDPIHSAKNAAMLQPLQAAVATKDAKKIEDDLVELGKEQVNILNRYFTKLAEAERDTTEDEKKPETT